MSLKRELKIQDIYQKIKNDMSEEVKNSNVIDYYGVKRTEQDFLINEIAKLQLYISSSPQPQQNQ